MTSATLNLAASNRRQAHRRTEQAEQPNADAIIHEIVQNRRLMQDRRAVPNFITGRQAPSHLRAGLFVLAAFAMFLSYRTNQTKDRGSPVFTDSSVANPQAVYTWNGFHRIPVTE